MQTAVHPRSVQLTLVQQGAFNRRFRVDLGDGSAVECVLYRNHTLCVSSQVGCGVGCPFCASGKNGLLRPLTLEELTGQLEAVRELGHRIERLTVSGVGEPLHNPHSVRALMEHCRAQGIAPSLTTSGGTTDRLRSALHWPHNGLTVSVHAGVESTRALVVPSGPRLRVLFDTLQQGWPELSRRRRRKIALAYLLLDGVNDADAEIDAFAERARTLAGVRVHLYAHNAVPDSPWQGVSRACASGSHPCVRCSGPAGARRVR